MAKRFVPEIEDLDAACKFKGASAVTKEETKLIPSNKKEWNNPPTMKGDPNPNPLDGGLPKLTIDLILTDALLEVRENLLKRLLDATETTVQALGRATAGSFKGAVEDTAEALRSVVAETRRRADYFCFYDVELAPAGLHTVFMEHTHTFQNKASQTLPTKSQKTNSLIDTRLNAGGTQLDLFYLRRPRPGQAKALEDVAYASGVTIAGTTLRLGFSIGLEVYFEGFNRELDLDKVLKRLQEIIDAAVAAGESFSAARILVKRLGKELGIDVGKVDDLSKNDLLEKLRDLTEKSMRAVVDAFKVLINQFTELIRLDKNTVTLYCLSAKGYKRYKEFVAAIAAEKKAQEVEVPVGTGTLTPPVTFPPNGGATIPTSPRPDTAEPRPEPAPVRPGRGSANGLELPGGTAEVQPGPAFEIGSAFAGSERIAVPFDVVRRAADRLSLDDENELATELGELLIRT